MHACVLFLCLILEQRHIAMAYANYILLQWFCVYFLGCDVTLAFFPARSRMTCFRHLIIMCLEKIHYHTQKRERAIEGRRERDKCTEEKLEKFTAIPD